MIYQINGEIGSKKMEPDYCFCQGKTNSEQDAKDVLQESIYRLWKSYSSKEDGTFDPPPLPLAFTAVRNTAIDFARKTGRRIKENKNLIK